MRTGTDNTPRTKVPASRVRTTDTAASAAISGRSRTASRCADDRDKRGRRLVKDDAAGARRPTRHRRRGGRGHVPGKFAGSATWPGRLCAGRRWPRPALRGVALNLQQPRPHGARAPQVSNQPRPIRSHRFRRRKGPDIARVRLPQQCPQPVGPLFWIGVFETPHELTCGHAGPPEEIGTGMVIGRSDRTSGVRHASIHCGQHPRRPSSPVRCVPLDRDVAIKVLRDAFSADPDRVARSMTNDPSSDS